MDKQKSEKRPRKNREKMSRNKPMIETPNETKRVREGIVYFREFDIYCVGIQSIVVRKC